MNKTRVLVIGAGGIIGQHMMVAMPDWAEARFTRREAYQGFVELDLAASFDVQKFIADFDPHVIINLAGENSVDKVEEFPKSYQYVNVEAPGHLAYLCKREKRHLIHVSTQGVFSGDNSPYKAADIPHPITEYGKQKRDAEMTVLAGAIPTSKDDIIWRPCIARVTFVLGVRPFQEIGRQNPLEQMFAQRYQLQVNDRFFSPAWAPDVAKQLWKLAHKRQKGIVHIGEPVKTSRYGIACQVYHDLHLPLEERPRIEAVSHEYFPGIAPRPINTEWAFGSLYDTKTIDHLISAYGQWKRLNGPTNIS